MILVLDAHVEAQYAFDGQCVENRQEPRLQRIGIDHDGNARRQQFAAIGQTDLAQHLVFEHDDLPGKSRQMLAGLCRPARRAALQKDLAETLLEQPDPLADGRRRDVQPPRCGFEATLLENRSEGSQLGVVDFHELDSLTIA